MDRTWGPNPRGSPGVPGAPAPSPEATEVRLTRRTPARRAGRPAGAIGQLPTVALQLLRDTCCRPRPHKPSPLWARRPPSSADGRTDGRADAHSRPATQTGTTLSHTGRPGPAPAHSSGEPVKRARASTIALPSGGKRRGGKAGLSRDKPRNPESGGRGVRPGPHQLCRCGGRDRDA